MSLQFPDKLYLKIGEVADLTGVKPHVLRYWESEFGSFRPGKSRKQQRLYRQKDVELVLRLKDLLYGQGYTIAGAKKKLREPSTENATSLPQLTETAKNSLLNEIISDLRQLRQSLETIP
jgi:DNA-binding transcriptional MerR regulator